MKTNYLFLAFSVATLTFTSCSSEVEDVLETQEEQVANQDSVFTYDMYLDGGKTSYDGTTRGTTANDWENGDIVYLLFTNGGSSIYGKAEYISVSNKWRVTSKKTLTEITDATCEVWYCEGINPKERTNSQYDYIGYDYMTEAYLSKSGKYTYSNNGIYVNATMSPYSWRLHFKGTTGTQITITSSTSTIGIYTRNITNSSYVFSGPFWTDYKTLTMTVGSNGFTDYFVGTADNACSSIMITDNSTGDSFYRYFDSNTLNEGESGCFTIPTKSDLHGWTLSE